MNAKGIGVLFVIVTFLMCVAPVGAQPLETVFDTDEGTYPSIMGVHKGYFTPQHDINVHQIHTYPCAGTGGHSEYVAFYENGNEIANACWDGYQSDYHDISFDVSLPLYKGVVYGYELRTGSYPQIVHNQTLINEYGTINCTSFVDANGRFYNNRIPAIRLEGYFVDGEGVHNIDTGKNFSTIQAAIDDNETKDGHIIEVDAGTYKENVNVTKRLTLQGIGMPTVDANGSGSAITVSVDGCVVDGFTVTGGGSGSESDYYAGIKLKSAGNTLTNNMAVNNDYGIVLWRKRSDNRLTNNTVKSNKYDGIFVYHAPNNHIMGNVVTDNDVGINLKMNCSYSVISDNIISGNKAWGFRLYIPMTRPSMPPFCSNYLTITNNNVSNNGNGIYMFSGFSSTITDNTVCSNAGYGMNLRLSCYNKLRNNVLYDNKYNFGVDCVGTTWDQDIDTTNTVDDKPIYFLVGISGITIDEHTNAGYVGLVSCNKITVKNLNLTNNGQGIVVAETRNSTLRNNTIMANEVGVHVYRSVHNIVVYHNNFENNTIQALNTWGWNIMWDNGSVEGGNYWSDHECTGNPSNGSQPYYIPSGTQDRYPFADPLGWGSVHNRDTGKNFLTIQAAIDDPNTQVGHTIEVDVGTYVENIVITKRLILRGIGMPTVDANGAGSAITVSADGCVVEGFNMTGGYDAGIKVTSGSNMLVNNTASNNTNCGIMLRSASNNTLTNNVVSSNGCGISIDYSPNNYIIDNRISDNEAGIELIMGSSYNNITNNTIFSNKVRGIRQTTPQLPSATSSFVTFARTSGLNIPQKSSNNILKDDILYSSSDYNSDYLTIANNNISYNGNGITLSDSCNNNNITGNIVSFNTGNGISLHGSSGNKLRNNILRDNRYNFGVWSRSASGYYQDIDTSNTVNEKPIYYLVEKSDLTSDITLDEHTNAGYVGIISCHNRWHNITVKNLNLTNNRQGILVVRSSNVILDNNTVQNNEEGIYLYKSDYNLITSCNVSSNAKNIYLYYSSSNNITGNSISKGRWGVWLFCGGYSNIIGNNVSSNGDTGISLYSSSGNNIIANTVSSNGCYGIDLRDSSNNVLTCNTVSVNGYSSGVGLGINLHCSNKNILYHNNLINNTKNARDIEKDNLWDKGSIVGGNYWSDHECTGNPSDGTQPYISHRSVDHYPFEDPWGWDKE